MKRAALTWCAVAVGATVLGIGLASWWDRQDPAVPVQPAAGTHDAQPPGPLDPTRVSAAPGLEFANPAGMRLEQGGWVQIARPDGSLAQQYSASRLDPEPGQWLAMVEPRLVAFMEDGRVLTLRANEARTYVPQRALERGDFRGDVIAKVFEPGPDGEVHLGADSPAIVFEAPSADVDFLHGAIHCPDEVRVTSRVLRFEGVGLELQMTADRASIESLHVAQVVGPITIDRSTADSLGGASGARTEKPGGALSAPAVVGPRPHVRLESNGAERAASAPAPFHRVTLRDRVRIVRYANGPTSSFEGDRLEAVLSLKDGLTGLGGFALPGAPESASASPIVPHRPEAIALLAIAATSGLGNSRAQQPDHGDMIAVWADGPLDVVRVGDGDPVPPTADGVLLALDGKPLGVQSASAQGVQGLHATRMDVTLERQEGATVPRSLIASGGIEATDGQQTLWSSALRVRFSDGAAPDGPNAAVDPLIGSAEVERADAEGGVELQLEDGVRAWGDRVQAWPQRRQADLHGPGVQVVRGNARLHDVERIQVDEAKRTVVSPGSGKASIYAQTVLPAGAAGRLGTPSVDGLSRQSWATWTEAMKFEDRGAEGAVLGVSGEVRLQSEPDASEWDRLDAASLEVVFAPSRTAAASEAWQAGAGAPLEAESMRARGGAKLESQVWPGAKDGSRGEPELFRIAAEDIAWQGRAQEAHVPVAGEMLMHRPRRQADEGGAAAPQAGPAASMPGSLGTTRYRWQGEMHFEKRPDGLSQARLEKGVEIVHLAIDRQAKTTLTCDRALAVVRRDAAAAPAQGIPAAHDAQATPIQFGSGGELVRLIAEGRCFLRSPENDIDCESIEYDAATQVATLRAREGRDVAITPANGGTTIRAVEATWDLASGRIRVQGMRGNVAR